MDKGNLDRKSPKGLHSKSNSDCHTNPSSVNSRCLNSVSVNTLYNVDSKDMSILIKMHNNKAQRSGAALKKCILECLPVEILEQMQKINLSRKSNDTLNSITTG